MIGAAREIHLNNFKTTRSLVPPLLISTVAPGMIDVRDEVAA